MYESGSVLFSTTDFELELAFLSSGLTESWLSQPPSGGFQESCCKKVNFAGMQSRCEVCDDTNATIHCQECRRKTCEECDEILHLVDANKSHHRIPLYPSRGASAVNSRSGSQVPTRNVSPRGPRRPFQEQENAIAEYSANKPDFAESPATSNQNQDTKLFDHDSGPASFASIPAKRYALTQQEVPVAQAPSAPNPPVASQYNNYPPPPSHQVQQQRAAPPPPQQQAPPPPPQQQQFPQAPLQQAPPPPSQQQQQRPQQRIPDMRPAQPLQPYARPDPPRQALQPHSAQSRSGYATPSYGQYHPGSRTGPHSVTHSGAATPTYGARPVVYNQYGQPTHGEPAQHPVYQNQPQSQPFNGDRRFHPEQSRPVSTNEDQMRKAYLQHMQVIEQHKAVEAHQRLMAQRSEMMNRQPQPHQPFPRQGQVVFAGNRNMQAPHRYYVNMPSSFSSAAPSARNSPPLQPIRPASGLVSGHVSGFVTPGDPSRGFVPLDPARFSYPAPAPAPAPFPQPGPQMMSFVPAPPGPPVFDPVRGTFAPAPPAVYSMPASVPRTPFHEPHSPPSFMPPRVVPYGVSASVPRTPYNEPRTPYNEPRTPFEPRSPAAEPVAYTERMPASRPVSFPPPPSSMAAPVPQPPRPGYASRDYGMPQQQPASSFPSQAPHQHHHAPPPPPAQPTRALPPQNSFPTSSQPPSHFPSQAQPQYPDGMASPYRTMDISQKPPTISTNHVNPPKEEVPRYQPPPKEDVVMTPNGSLNRVMADTERPVPTVTVPPAQAPPPPSRYDPDEAETRVRNLIADTERMLAGLSGFSSGRNQTNGVSV